MKRVQDFNRRSGRKNFAEENTTVHYDVVGNNSSTSNNSLDPIAVIMNSLREQDSELLELKNINKIKKRVRPVLTPAVTDGRMGNQNLNTVTEGTNHGSSTSTGVVACSTAFSGSDNDIADNITSTKDKVTNEVKLNSNIKLTIPVDERAKGRTIYTERFLKALNDEKIDQVKRPTNVDVKDTKSK